jgi:hypothetical protein
MRLALQAFESGRAADRAEAMTALRDALRHPKQEPQTRAAELHALKTELWRAPPSREWVSLTDEELDYWVGSNRTKKALCRAIDAALKEMNT